MEWCAYLNGCVCARVIAQEQAKHLNVLFADFNIYLVCLNHNKPNNSNNNKNNKNNKIINKKKNNSNNDKLYQ